MKNWQRAALVILLLAPRLSLAQQAPWSRPIVEQVGSFEVSVGTDFFTREDQSRASVTPHGQAPTATSRRATIPGDLLWACTRSGVWVGVGLSATADGGESRPVEWRFDDDAPATTSLVGVRGYRRWFLPPEDVVRFTVRARTARSLVIRMPDDGAEYAYELEHPRQALDRLACVRGTPVAGRLPQPSISGRGVAGPIVPVPPRTSAPAAASAPTPPASPTTTAAQQRACSAADSARVAWSPPPGVADGAWQGLLLTLSLVTPQTEMVRMASDSMPGAGESERQLFWELDRVVRERLGDQRVKVVILMRVEPDSTLSRLLMALPTGRMAGIEQSIPERIRRMPFRPLFRDGCPLVTLSPLVVEIFPTQRIGQRPGRAGAVGDGDALARAGSTPRR